MSHEDNVFNKPEVPHLEVEQRMRSNLSRAVEAVTGDGALDPLQVFPDPADKERREDIVFEKTLDETQEALFRGAMAEMGIGREANRDAAELGLPEGYLALLEGGQAHKMLAELTVTVGSDVKPGVIVMSGDAERVVAEKECELTARILGLTMDQVGATEVEIAEQVLRVHPDFIEQEEKVLPYGYTMAGALTQEATGQFRQIGLVAGVPAVVMRVDREWYETDAGERKFKRPDNFTKLKIVSGIDGVGSIGFVTSATYQPSAEIDAIRASKETGTLIHVPTYGTAELARVKGETVPQPPALQQLAGEAYKVAQQLDKLEV
jgi:hypothetical protein